MIIWLALYITPTGRDWSWLKMPKCRIDRSFYQLSGIMSIRRTKTLLSVQPTFIKSRSRFNITIVVAIGKRPFNHCAPIASPSRLLALGKETNVYSFGFWVSCFSGAKAWPKDLFGYQDLYLFSWKLPEHFK